MLPARRLVSLLTLLAMTTLLGLTGCGPRWVVVRQVVPNPMSAGAPFYVQPISLEGLRVGDKTEAEWMGPKGASTQASWEGDKVAMNEQFHRGFDGEATGVVQAASPAGAFTIVTHFAFYEPGFFAGIVSRPGRIDAIVDIVDPNGTPLDQLTTSAAYSGVSQGENARGCARIIGRNIARYIKARTGQ
jgi:hypothetical protein